MAIRFFSIALIAIFLVACQQEVQKKAAAPVALASATGKTPILSALAPAETRFILQSADDGKTWDNASTTLPAEAQNGRLFSTNGDLYLSIEGGYYLGNPSTGSPMWTKKPFPDPAITSVYHFHYRNGWNTLWMWFKRPRAID
jgi:hypothetical protein